MLSSRLSTDANSTNYQMKSENTQTSTSSTNLFKTPLTGPVTRLATGSVSYTIAFRNPVVGNDTPPANAKQLTLCPVLASGPLTS